MALYGKAFNVDTDRVIDAIYSSDKFYSFASLPAGGVPFIQKKTARIEETLGDAVQATRHE
jgi:hypothetical protein